MPESRNSVHQLMLNQRSDVSSPNAILACCHFPQSNHKFNTHAKLTLMETTTSRKKQTEIIQDNLRTSKNFWINTLQTLHPHGLNQEQNS